MSKIKEKSDIVYLKIHNGHEIWIFKKTVNKFRYYGRYQKPQTQLNKTGGK